MLLAYLRNSAIGFLAAGLASYAYIRSTRKPKQFFDVDPVPAFLTIFFAVAGASVGGLLTVGGYIR